MANVMIDEKFKRMCDVPGCKGRNTVRIMRVKGYGEQLFMCKDCLKEAYALAFPAVAVTTGYIEVVEEAEATEETAETVTGVTVTNADTYEAEETEKAPAAPKKAKRGKAK